MRHGKKGRHLGRSSGHRKALYRNLITELFRYERIQTIWFDETRAVTAFKAGELKGMPDTYPFGV